jgi:hypothetical protein
MVWRDHAPLCCVFLAPACSSPARSARTARWDFLVHPLAARSAAERRASNFCGRLIEPRVELNKTGSGAPVRRETGKE